eukprot:3275090-Amphidinium_carterae.1
MARFFVRVDSVPCKIREPASKTQQRAGLQQMVRPAKPASVAQTPPALERSEKDFMAHERVFKKEVDEGIKRRLPTTCTCKKGKDEGKGTRKYDYQYRNCKGKDKGKGKGKGQQAKCSKDMSAATTESQSSGSGQHFEGYCGSCGKTKQEWNGACTYCSSHAQRDACVTSALLLDGLRIRKRFNVTSLPCIPAKAVLAFSELEEGGCELQLSKGKPRVEGALEGGKRDEAEEDNPPRV